MFGFGIKVKVKITFDIGDYLLLKCLIDDTSFLYGGIYLKVEFVGNMI